MAARRGNWGARVVRGSEMLACFHIASRKSTLVAHAQEKCQAPYLQKRNGDAAMPTDTKGHAIVRSNNANKACAKAGEQPPARP